MICDDINNRRIPLGHNWDKVGEGNIMGIRSVTPKFGLDQLKTSSAESEASLAELSSLAEPRGSSFNPRTTSTETNTSSAKMQS